MKYPVITILFLFVSLWLGAQTNLTDSIVHQGFQRKFMVHLPPGFNPSVSLPLVISLHGGSGNMINAQGFSMLNPVADQHGFVIAWPQGYGIAPPGFSWADGRNTSADMAGIDDVGFINQLTETLLQRFNLDPDRIYLCGFSNGGFMVQRMACQSSAKFAAMASLGSSMDTVLFRQCNPEKPVPLAFFNGTADPAMPYGGGPLQNPLVIPVVPVDSTVLFWVRQNECKKTEPAYFFPDIFLSDNSTAELYTYTDCSCEADVLFYKLINGGHTWPGVFVASQAAILGNTNRDINAGQELWKFFKNHSLCDPTVGTEGSPKSFGLTIYPNPALDYLYIQCDETADFSVDLLDFAGKTVLTSQSKKEININHILPGMYIVVLKTDQRNFTGKFIKL